MKVMGIFITIIYSFLLLACSSDEPIHSITPPSQNPKVEARTYAVDGATISGTITYTDMSTSIVLIIPGSGPTDRDGNNPLGVSAQSYKLISDALITEDIASLRVDKRGIGQSSPVDEVSLTFDLYIDDYRRIVDELSKEYNKVYLLGHSEGAQVATILAKENKAAGLLSVSSTAKSFDKIILDQLSAQAPMLVDDAKVVLDSLAAGHLVSNVPPMLLSLFRPSVQPYLISLIKYVPTEDMAQVTVPTIIISGTTDIQVPSTEAEALSESNTNAQLVIIEEMNHVLKRSSSDRMKNLGTYSNPNLPLHEELMPTIISFLKG